MYFLYELLDITQLDDRCFSVTGTWTGTISYLYTRLKFAWTEYEFTAYVSTAIVVGTLTNISLIPLLSIVFKLRDTTIGAIATLSGTAQNIVIAFATKWWMMYIGEKK